MRMMPIPIVDLALPLSIGALACASGLATIDEPLGRALWMVVAGVLLLPLALDLRAGASPPRDSGRGRPGSHDGSCVLRFVPYAVACVPLVVATLWVAGVRPALVVAAVAGSLAGGARLLATFRVRADLAVALTIAGALVALTWPVWAASSLAAIDGRWVQWVVNVSPAFALNAAIAPDDPLTHRPLAYRLMNLGQDVSYAMPTGVWPCVVLHLGVGVVGVIGRGWNRPRMNADERG